MARFSRHTQKTINEIMTQERIKQGKLLPLLKELGFQRRVTASSHQVYKHKNGTRFVYPVNVLKDAIWGYFLKDVRNLLKEWFEKEGLELPIPESDYSLIDPERESIKDHYDKTTLAEQKFSNVTKINLKGNEMSSQSITNPNYKQEFENLKKICQSTQEQLLSVTQEIAELNRNINEHFGDIHDAISKVKVKDATSSAEAALTPIQKQGLERIKQAWKDYPALTEDDYVMAGIAKVDSRTYKKMKAQKLFGVVKK